MRPESREKTGCPRIGVRGRLIKSGMTDREREVSYEEKRSPA